MSKKEFRCQHCHSNVVEHCGYNPYTGRPQFWCSRCGDRSKFTAGATGGKYSVLIK